MTDTIDALLMNTPYRVTGFLGRGGMGEVYRVEHAFLGREFALKILFARHAENPGVIDRMRIEAQATARLAHPNIVDVSDFWLASDGRPCIVMELLQGSTVARELTVRGPFSVQLAVEYTHQLLAALMAAHKLGVVHRDIKPENLFLHDLPEGSRILKVLDFGIARVLPEASALAPARPVEPTATGFVVGSPRFASPEGLRGEKVDCRADVFSAGLVLYSMLTRRGPFDNMRTTDNPEFFQVKPPSQRIDSFIPPELDSFVLKAIRWDAAQRYQSVAAFASDLQLVRDTLDMVRQ
jgi:serine/threonine-protein kinase